MNGHNIFKIKWCSRSAIETMLLERIQQLEEVVFDKSDMEEMIKETRLTVAEDIAREASVMVSALLLVQLLLFSGCRYQDIG
jgi:hypothetical protein